MNTDVTAVVDEKAAEHSKEERCTESFFVELGQVSKDTQGGFWGLPDGGFFKQF